ncbi:MAG: hypothetical protein ACI4S2_06710 [Lachnospiraceae bacterium]
MLKGKAWIDYYLAGIQSTDTLRDEDMFSMYHHVGTQLISAMKYGSLELDEDFVDTFTELDAYLEQELSKEQEYDAGEVNETLYEMDNLINEILFRYDYALTSPEGDGACFIIAEIPEEYRE